MIDALISYVRVHPEVLYLAALMAVLIVIVRLQNTSYRLGVNDGYGYAREPWNPGYSSAGEWLRENCSYRWPELRTIVTKDNEGYHSQSSNDSDFEVESVADEDRPPVQHIQV